MKDAAARLVETLNPTGVAQPNLTHAVGEMEGLMAGVRAMAESGTAGFRAMIDDRVQARQDEATGKALERQAMANERALERAHELQLERIRAGHSSAGVGGTSAASGTAPPQPAGAGPPTNRGPKDRYEGDLWALLDEAGAGPQLQLLMDNEWTVARLVKSAGKRGSQQVVTQLIDLGVSSGDANAIIDELFDDEL